jgi:hypothetical protein
VSGTPSKANAWQIGATVKATKPSDEFEKFDKAMDKIMSVSKKELDRRLAEAKKNKIGKRYPKPKAKP